MATKGYKLDELWDDEILQMLAVIRPTSTSFPSLPLRNLSHRPKLTFSSPSDSHSPQPTPNSAKSKASTPRRSPSTAASSSKPSRPSGPSPTTSRSRTTRTKPHSSSEGPPRADRPTSSSTRTGRPLAERGRAHEVGRVVLPRGGGARVGRGEGEGKCSRPSGRCRWSVRRGRRERGMTSIR